LNVRLVRHIYLKLLKLGLEQAQNYAMNGLLTKARHDK
jgi:hypothetical protein